MAFLAKVMRRFGEEDFATVRAELGENREKQRQDTAAMHRLEAIRDRLVDGDDAALAAVIAEDLTEIGDGEPADDPEGDVEDDADLAAPPAHDSAPFGDADIVEDLGTSAAELLAMCAHEGTLPIDVLVAVCEKAGCGDTFDGLRS